MDNQSISQTISPSPPWTWRSVGIGILMTALIYIGLPGLEMLTSKTKENHTLRDVQTVDMPPPPPPPPQQPKQKVAQPDPPRPKLKQPRQRIIPIQSAMDLSMGFGNIKGDFAIDFGIEAGALKQQIQDLIFEVSELDNPPRPLVRLEPVYPPHARMRRIEGYVHLEFLVDTSGDVQDVNVLSSQPGDTFLAAAIRAVERWRFEPGTKDGKPVVTRVRQNVNFQLD